MKRVSILILALAVTGLMFAACGGGGGGGGVDSSAVLRAIALFADNGYVDYSPGASGSEASNLEAALRDMGHTVTPFTGLTGSDWSDALSGKHALVLPELEMGDLAADISAEARDAVSGFVNDGGILFITLSEMVSDWSLDFLNAAFGYSMAGTENIWSGETLSYISTGAAGTAFEDAVPATVPANDGTFLVDPATVPSAGKIIYTSAAGNAALIYIPHGDGHIVISGYDGWSFKPVGYQDSGWWGVFYRAVALDAEFNDACVVFTGPAGQGEDVAQSLRQTGQFETVDTFYAGGATPSLAQLNDYDSVLVYAYAEPYADSTALGNVVADYVDSGGGAVLGLYTYYTSSAPDWSLMGRFAVDDYYALPGNAEDVWAAESLDTIYFSAHPTMAGVQELDVNAYPDTTSVNTGATRIADYSAGAPVAATREIDGVRRADLGVLPDIYDGYDNDTDGALLIANALTWTAELGEPGYISNSTSPGLSIDSPAGVNCTQQSVINLSGGPDSISKVRVELDITHTYIWDLTIDLESPEGTTIILTDNNGDGGDNMNDTVFDDWAGRSIEVSNSGDQPYTGTWIPEESLAGYIGEDANGSWTLTVTDDGLCGMDGGTFDSWKLMVR